MGNKKKRHHYQSAQSPISHFSFPAHSRQSAHEPAVPWWHPQTVIFWLLLVLVAVTPYIFYFHTDELFEFNKMVFVYGICGFLLGAWLTRMIIEKRVVWRKTWLDIPILLFVVSQVLSTLASIHPYTSFFGYYSRFHGGLLSTFAYVLIYYAAVSNLDLRQVRRLLITTLVASAGIALYAIPEHFGHSFSCLMVSGGSSFDAECWKQNVQDRVFASFGQPNWLAAYVVMLLPLSTLFATYRKISGKFRGFFAILTVALLWTLIFTKSRSGLLGLAGTFGLASLGIAWQWWLNKEKFTQQFVGRWVVGVGLACMLSVALFGTPFTPALSDLFQSSKPTPTTASTETVQPTNRLDIGGSESGDIRKIVWTGAIKVWQRYPILGSGVETFAYSYYLDRPMEHNNVSEWDFLYNKAHNEFLNYLATTGIVGLSSYLILLIAPGIYLLFKETRSFKHTLASVTSEAESNVRYTQHSSPAQTELDQYQLPSLLAWLMLSGIFGLSISNFFGFSTVMVTLLQYLFFALIVLLTDGKSQSHSQQPKQELDGGQVLGIFLASILSFVLFICVIRYWMADLAYSQSKVLFDQGNGQAGLIELTKSIRIMPYEAFYYDELSSRYSEIAALLTASGAATEAAQFEVASLQASDMVMRLNPHHLNFYKSRTSVFIRLSQLNSDYYNMAIDTLEQARLRAPTDPKLVFTTGVLQLQTNQAEAGIANLEKAIEMKPNYYTVYLELGEWYTQAGQSEKAIEWYEKLLILLPNDEATKAKIKNLKDTSAAGRAQPN